MTNNFVTIYSRTIAGVIP